jgi:predicted DNA-binding protein
MTEQLLIRVAPELKRKLARMASLEGKTSTQVVRDLIQEYIRQRDLPGYIDDVWTRIAADLAAKGVKPRDVAKTIRAVRKSARADAGRH